MAEDRSADPMPLQGEGDYISGRKYQKAQADFARKGPVGEKSREAADALDGPEGPDLEAARAAAAQGESQAHKPGRE